MNKKKLSVLSAAIAAVLGSTGVDASTIVATLTSVTAHTPEGSLSGFSSSLASSTATWSYDDVTGVLSQSGGTFNVLFRTNPTTTIFRHSITGLVIGNGGVASATTYVCTDGNLGASEALNICGNYGYGANLANESTATWGPGTATARTLGGDDIAGAPGFFGTILYWNASGTPQSIADYNGFSTVSWVGTTLTLSNALCKPASPGSANGCATTGGVNSGYTWVLNATPAVVPVPAAVFLFGSALGVMGWMRRKAS